MYWPSGAEFKHRSYGPLTVTKYCESSRTSFYTDGQNTAVEYHHRLHPTSAWEMNHTRWSHLPWATNRCSLQPTTWHETKATRVTPRCWILFTKSTRNHLLAWYEQQSEGADSILWNLSQVRNQQSEGVSNATWSAQPTMGTNWSGLFELYKKEFMVTVDYFSNFWEVDGLTTTASAAIILKLKNHLARYGCPNCLTSDNGPQFTSSEFIKFTKEWDFQHRTNSLGNSKVNGKVESALIRSYFKKKYSFFLFPDWGRMRMTN